MSRVRYARRGQRRNDGQAQGDIPKPVKYTQSTLSTRVPRVTDIFTARSLTVTTSGITASATVNVAPTYNFSLSDIDNANAFIGLFDQYRIDAVRFIIKPNNNAIGLVTNSTTSIVPLYCVIDYDNTGTLASAVAARSYDNCVILTAGESLCRTFKPHVAVAAYSGAFSSFANQEDEWIDSDSSTVQHYGIKVFVPAATAAQTLLQSWTVEREYFISFRKITTSL